MINISRRHPWALWPNSICPAFLDKPAVDRLQGDQYWKIDITFSYNEVNMKNQKDIFCIVPKYTGLSVYEKRIFIGVGHEDEDDWHGTGEFIQPNIKDFSASVNECFSKNSSSGFLILLVIVCKLIYKETVLKLLNIH
jgi:hypothetical protein